MTEECTWQLFQRESQDCISCVYYSDCLKEVEKRANSAEAQMQTYFKTTTFIEDDAKEYAEFLRELDRMDSDMFGDEPVVKDEEEQEHLKYLNKYKELTAIASYLEQENIPIVFYPPNELYGANFLMVTYASNLYTLRLTSISGVPKDIKFINRVHKAKNNRNFKYLKKSTLDVIFPLIKNIVSYRKKYV